MVIALPAVPLFLYPMVPIIFHRAARRITSARRCQMPTFMGNLKRGGATLISNDSRRFLVQKGSILLYLLGIRNHSSRYGFMIPIPIYKLIYNVNGGPTLYPAWHLMNSLKHIYIYLHALWMHSHCLTRYLTT